MLLTTSPILQSAKADTESKKFDNIFVFGDSLSDAGNFANGGSYNYEGRHSNGKVWHEYLAENLGLPAITKSSNYSEGDGIEKGYNNFSYAGACSSDYWSVSRVVERYDIDISSYTSLSKEEVCSIVNIDKQIYDSKNLDKCFARYNYTFTDKDLVAIWGGANDFMLSPLVILGILTPATAGRNTADSICDNIESLITRYNAKHILTLNMPNISITPQFVNSESKTDATDFVNTFNLTYAKNMALLEDKYKDVCFYEVDIFTLLNDVVENYTDYGFTYYLTTVQGVGSSTEKQAKCLFYDGVHPSTTAHKLLADIITKQLTKSITLSSHTASFESGTASNLEVDYAIEGFNESNTEIEWLSTNTAGVNAKLEDNKVKVTINKNVSAGNYVFRINSFDEADNVQVFSHYFNLSIVSPEEPKEPEKTGVTTKQIIIGAGTVVLLGGLITTIALVKKHKS